MKIGELFVKLGFDVDSKGLKDVDKGMNNARTGAIAMTVAVTGLTIAMKKMITTSLESAVVLKNFQIQTGLSREEFQKWRFVSEQNDVSGQELISTIKGIQQAQAAIRLGGGNIKPFQLLGISPTEDPFQVLEQLRGKIKNLDPAIASSVLGQMGIGDNFLNVLKNSNLEFGKLNKQFLLSRKEQDTLIQLNKSFKDLGFALRGIRNRFIALITPEIISFFKAVKNNFLAIIDIGKYLVGLVNEFKGLAKIIAIVGGAIAAYFFPVTAIILGVIAVIDDLYTFIKGGDSVFGLFADTIINNFNKLKTMVESVFLFFKEGYDKYVAPIIDKLEGALNNNFFSSLFGKDDKEKPVSASTNNNTNSNVNNINISVGGETGNSKKTALDIKDALKKELNKVYYTRSASGV